MSMSVNALFLVVKLDLLGDRRALRFRVNTIVDLVATVRQRAKQTKTKKLAIPSLR